MKLHEFLFELVSPTGFASGTHKFKNSFKRGGLVKVKVQKGIVLPDTITGEDYCVQVTNGEIVKTKGNCP